jgi:hypothetical protein
MPFLTEFSRNDTVSVGTTAVRAASPYDDRKVIYIRNISTGGQVITLFFSDSSTATASGGGIVLNPNDYIIDSLSESYTPWRGPITAISSAASGTLSIYER